ncbi:MAG: hypothetical protein ACJAYN_002178 [Bermanella sp.]
MVQTVIGNITVSKRYLKSYLKISVRNLQELKTPRYQKIELAVPVNKFSLAREVTTVTLSDVQNNKK